ncbi:16S ribosomal RNA methyltransferase A [Stygiolobus caldivivus]|uniref:16S rRNA (Adenine(1518)-N(6)/adenine(1519)-N(6))-dimethyltransferase n=1 Tax=Stygiolobus caldivivus TaxID=2824673 RepID=A0A8D5U785_9CREN|nr:16S ribosomal RNA methyltransferase A [Stygiolobus caldivivus]BCU70609.1 16S rRNA (adenine(1518)-N(6)/adenine(1519)-N(6)) - dimethyltransferase [Stygiolobus caldivivus]
MAKKGQHFLVDVNTVKRIISYVDFSQRPLIEIGGGKGALTSILNPDLTIELDPTLIPFLMKYNLVIADAVNPPFSRGQVVSSLPYYITFDFMTTMVKLSGVQRLVLVLQKDFIDKVINDPTYISFTLNFHFKIFPKEIISPRSFYPKPRVFSQIVVFERIKSYNFYVDEALRCISSYKNKKLSSLSEFCKVRSNENKRIRDFKPWQVTELLKLLDIGYV